MAHFEGYERREAKILAALKEYGISSLDENDQVIGYEFVSLGKMTDFIKKGMEPNEAYAKSMGTYGRFAEAAKYIDPRKQ